MSAVRSLGQVARIWLDRNDPLREETVLALQVSTGFTRSMIEKALDAAFEALTEEKLAAYVASEPAFKEGLKPPAKVLHVLAGNVFTSWLPGAVTTLLLGASCALKPSSQEPVFAPLWKRSIERVDPALGQQIEIVRWDDSLPARYGAVVAYGTDGTIASLRAKTPAKVRFIPYGHKFSVAILWKEALAADALPQVLEQLQSDIEPFNLQGCLSPRFIFLEGGDPSLLSGLASKVSTMPIVRRFDEWEVLKAELKAYRTQISALGVAGPPGHREALKRDQSALGLSRVCSVGEMQRPGLDWKNGGFSLADALTATL